MAGLTDIEEVRVDTPFGQTSDTIIIGILDEMRVAFLPRHGVGHRILPSELPVRANIYALKTLGVEFILGISAVGSLREDIEPLHMVVPDQLIDRTRGRSSTFFGDGLVAHVSLADPFCPELRTLLANSARQAGAEIHNGGTYIVMEGPSFSTRAESKLYRSWGGDIIGMTALPEAKLAREAEICYSILASSTDYDCWRESEEDVTADMIVATLLKNVEVTQTAARHALRNLPRERNCQCANALESAIVTSMDLVPESTKRKLEPIIGRYIGEAVAGGGA
ncbi:MAG: S-methyl-5'-thioadenosine phosphorylase [Chloroflexi bacterium]|nr:S-methyl-5'-thioadenosine phosphorylase [Chloroflexota bacterium]